MDGDSRSIMTQFPNQGKVTLITFAERHCFPTGTDYVLSGISTVIGLVPYLRVQNVAKLAVTGWPDRMDGNVLVYQGWMAVISSLINMLIYFGVLMRTHPSTPRTVRSMGTVALRHLTRFPVGYFKQRGSGKLGRIIGDGAGQTETYLVHQLPGLASTLVTPAVILVLLLVLDWRFGLISLIPTAVGVFF